MRFAENGDLIVCGQSNNWDNGVETFTGPAGWIVRFTKEGIKLWEKEYVKLINIDEELNGYTLFSDFQELPNGDFLVIGTVADTVWYEGEYIFDLDVLLMRTDSNGCIIDHNDCSDGQILTNTLNHYSNEEDFTYGFSVYPNPSEGQFYVNSKVHCTSCTLQIYNTQGKMIYSRDVIFEGDNRIKLPNDASGLNYVSISDFNQGLFNSIIYIHQD